MFKKSKPYKLTDISELDHALMTIDMTLSSGLCSVLVLKFSGEYGDDSDADFVLAIAAGACSFEAPDAVIFDLSGLACEPDESLASTFSFPLSPGGGGARAVRIVSGPKSHAALLKLKPSFESAEEGKILLSQTLEQALESLSRELKTK